MAPLEGFQEKGAPEAWDMAVGTVRGYRWWNVYTHFIPRGSRYATYTGGQPGSFGYHSLNPSPWVLCYDRSSVGGMHGGSWSRNWSCKDGWYEAKCAKYLIFEDTPQAGHAVPDPDCGCGYWAYWDRLNAVDFNSIPWVKYAGEYGYTVTIPLAGMAEGSGRTIIGEKGFRAERVRITDLAMSLDDVGCMFEDEVAADAFYMRDLHASYGGIRPAGNLVLPFLAQRLGTTPSEVMGAIVNAVELSLGNDFKWHPSPAAVLRDTKRDENYGEQAA